MVRRALGIGVVALLLVVGPVDLAFGQQTDPKLWEEIQALKRGQEDIRRQLLEIKQLLQGRQVQAAPEVRNMPVDLGTHPSKGSAAAKLTLIEFSDYQCPYCGRQTKETNPQLQREYVDAGKVRYVFFDMPLESMHKFAFKAAEAARCAGEQGKYWEMHDRLFANQQALEPWGAHAKALGLDVARFDTCMGSDKFAGAIRSDMAVAQKLGVGGTPTFLLASSDPNDVRKVTGQILRPKIKNRLL